MKALLARLVLALQRVPAKCRVIHELRLLEELGDPARDYWRSELRAARRQRRLLVRLEWRGARIDRARRSLELYERANLHENSDYKKLLMQQYLRVEEQLKELTEAHMMFAGPVRGKVVWVDWSSKRDPLLWYLFDLEATLNATIRNSSSANVMA